MTASELLHSGGIEDPGLRRIADRLAVEDVLAAYTALGDSGQLEGFAALFADDGILELQRNRKVVGPEEVLRFAREAGELLGSVPGLMPGGHHVSSRRVELTGEDEARATSVFLFVGASGPDHWGSYRDRLVRTDGGWRFAHRSVRVAGHAPGSGTREINNRIASLR